MPKYTSKNSNGLTLGKSSPKNSRRGCLCPDGLTYSTDCCDGMLINQGIGNITGVFEEKGSFSNGFSDGFEIN